MGQAAWQTEYVPRTWTCSRFDQLRSGHGEGVGTHVPDEVPLGVGEREEGLVAQDTSVADDDCGANESAAARKEIGRAHV